MQSAHVRRDQYRALLPGDIVRRRGSLFSYYHYGVLLGLVDSTLHEMPHHGSELLVIHLSRNEGRSKVQPISLAAFVADGELELVLYHHKPERQLALPCDADESHPMMRVLFDDVNADSLSMPRRCVHASIMRLVYAHVSLAVHESERATTTTTANIAVTSSHDTTHEQPQQQQHQHHPLEASLFQDDDDHHREDSSSATFVAADSRTTVVYRALLAIGKHGGRGYLRHLTGWSPRGNCEHFATWSATGISSSTQAGAVQWYGQHVLGNPLAYEIVSGNWAVSSKPWWGIGLLPSTTPHELTSIGAVVDGTSSPHTPLYSTRLIYPLLTATPTCTHARTALMRATQAASLRSRL